ncbi:MAG: Omp28-related outer membrane protein [Flavobacteriaceae bacterium]
MKTPLIKATFLILSLSFLMVSCSKREHFDLAPDFTLVLSSSSVDGVLLLSETLTFTVLTEEGVDYTADANFFVNGTQIAANTYSFSSEGSYEVYASYQGVVSNSLTFDVIDGNSRILTLSNTKVLRNQEVDFNVLDAEGNNYNSTATFYVNETSIAGSVFSAAQTGSFNVYAEYEVEGETFTSETKSFEIFIPKRKVVVEDYTGTWCGYCPAVTAAVDEVYTQTDKISVVAIHNNDDLALPIEGTIRTEFGVFGFPSGRINRTTSWGSTTNFPPSEVVSLAGEDVPVAISLSSSVNNGVLTVRVGMVSETNLQDRKLVLYLTEGNLLRDQTNYYDNDPSSPFYQMGNPIPNFEQKHVLRASLSDPFGDAIPSTNALTDYETTYTYTIPSGFVLGNLELVAMVVAMDNSAINSQHAAVNESAEYE